MEVETEVGKFTLGLMTHGEHGDTVRKALGLTRVNLDGGKSSMEAQLDHVTRKEYALLYSVKESPESHQIKTIQDVRNLPMRVGEVLSEAVDVLNDVTPSEK